jgi:putative peptidoglycan lipid II flippase
MRYAALSLTANTLGSIALFFLFRRFGLMPHLGIAVATTLGGWLNAGLLYATLARRGQFLADARLKRAIPLIAIASLLMGAVLFLLAAPLAALAARQGTLARAGALAALVAAGSLVYATAVLALGALEVRQLRRLVEPRPPAGRI